MVGGAAAVYSAIKTSVDEKYFMQQVETPPAMDVSIPYDAAARLAFAETDLDETDYQAFKEKWEAQQVANVIEKKKQRDGMMQEAADSPPPVELKTRRIIQVDDTVMRVPLSPNQKRRQAPKQQPVVSKTMSNGQRSSPPKERVALKHAITGSKTKKLEEAQEKINGATKPSKDATVTTKPIATKQTIMASKKDKPVATHAEAAVESNEAKKGIVSLQPDQQQELREIMSNRRPTKRITLLPQDVLEPRYVSVRRANTGAFVNK